MGWIKYSVFCALYCSLSKTLFLLLLLKIQYCISSRNSLAGKRVMLIRIEFLLFLWAMPCDIFRLTLSASVINVLLLLGGNSISMVLCIVPCMSFKLQLSLLRIILWGSPWWCDSVASWLSAWGSLASVSHSLGPWFDPGSGLCSCLLVLQED